MKGLIKHVWVVMIFLGAFSSHSMAGLLVSSDFDDGTLDGWQRKNDGKSGVISNPGGQEGGFILFTDGVTGGPAENILAPQKFLGDWSQALTNPTESFLALDAILFDPHVEQNNVDQILLFLSGAGGAAFIDLGLPSSEDDWQHFNAPLTETDWTITSGNWESLLSDISAFEIQMDWVNPQGKQTGVDNITLSLAQVVPEPYAGGLLLMLLGLMSTIRFNKARRD